MITQALLALVIGLESISLNYLLRGKNCRNPSLGLSTKAKACKDAGQEGSPRVTFHAPKNVGQCEGMNPYIPK